MLRIQYSLLLAFIACLLCCGCPGPVDPPPGGDPAVDQTATFEGTGEILTVTTDENGETVVSLKWTAFTGNPHEEPVENLLLSEFKDLPEDYEVKVGDKLALSVYIEFTRKMSVGPPYVWSNHRKREITFLPDGFTEI